MNTDKLEQSCENAIKNTGESPKYRLKRLSLRCKGRSMRFIILNCPISLVMNWHMMRLPKRAKNIRSSDIEVELQAAIKRAEGKEVLAKVTESQGSQPSAAN